MHGHEKKAKKILETLTYFQGHITKPNWKKIGQKYFNAHYLRSGSVDFTQICMNSISGHGNIPIKFWRPWLYFQGHIRIKTAKTYDKTYLNSHYLQTWSAGSSLICMNLIHGHGKKLIKFRRHWPWFQGHIRHRNAKFRPKILKCTLSSEWILPVAWIQYMDMRISQRKNWRPYCYGHIKIKLHYLGQKYLNTHYLQMGSADFPQIRMNHIHRHDKPHFQGHIRNWSC